MIKEIWNYKIQILPLVIGMFIYEVPAYLRRLKKLYYVPMYFSVFPLREINQDLSVYLGDDYFYSRGCDLSEHEADKLRKRIIFTAVLSGSIDAVLIPLLMGFISAFYMSLATFRDFLLLFFIYKGFTVYSSVRDFHYYSIASMRNRITLVLIYIAYIGVAIEMLKTSYNWAMPYINSGNWSGLWTSLNTFIFGKVLAQGVVFAVLVTIFTNVIADREVRKANVSRSCDTNEEK